DLDAPVVRVALEERPVAEAASNIARTTGKDVNSLDLAAGSDERHAPTRLADLEARFRELVNGGDVVLPFLPHCKAEREPRHADMNRTGCEQVGIIELIR